MRSVPVTTHLGIYRAIHWSTVCNQKKLETIHTSIGSELVKLIIVHQYNGLSCSFEKTKQITTKEEDFLYTDNSEQWARNRMLPLCKEENILCLLLYVYNVSGKIHKKPVIAVAYLGKGMVAKVWGRKTLHCLNTLLYRLHYESREWIAY